jgi:hypothetical protein
MHRPDHENDRGSFARHFFEGGVRTGRKRGAFARVGGTAGKSCLDGAAWLRAEGRPGRGAGLLDGAMLGDITTEHGGARFDAPPTNARMAN